MNWKEFIKESNESGTPVINPNRLTKDEYGCLMALSVASRSEDPQTITGCCITNSDGRIISTGYNGLIKGKPLISTLTKECYRDIKRSLFIHAETNALSLIRRGEGHIIYLTMSPCLNCAVNIAAHGIKNVVFINDYRDYIEYKDVFAHYRVLYRRLDEEEIGHINGYIQSNLIIVPLPPIIHREGMIDNIKLKYYI